MNVLHVHEVYSPYKGGSAIRIRNLCEAQLHENPLLNITVLCSYKGVDRGLTPADEIINGIKIKRIFNIRLIGLYALYFCLSNRVNILHIHNSRLFWFVYPFLFWKGNILELHSLRKLSGFKDRMQTLSIKLSSKIIVLSEATKKYLKNHLYVKREIFVIHNGVDYDKSKYRFVPLVDFHSKKMELVYAGSFYDWQGVFTIISLAEKFKATERKNSIKISIIGEGPCKQDLLNLLAFKQLEDILEIKGFMQEEELLKYLQNVSAFLFLRPKKRETELTFPLKILEVGLLGLPLIMTNREAHLELFPENNANSFCTIVSDDINDMYEQIINELDNYELLCEKAVNFRNFILASNFSWESSGRKINILYGR